MCFLILQLSVLQESAKFRSKVITWGMDNMFSVEVGLLSSLLSSVRVGCRVWYGSIKARETSCYVVPSPWQEHLERCVLTSIMAHLSHTLSLLPLFSLPSLFSPSPLPPLWSLCSALKRMSSWFRQLWPVDLKMDTSLYLMPAPSLPPLETRLWYILMTSSVWVGPCNIADN